MARSWHRPGRRRFTPITACPIRCSGGSTSSFSLWFWGWRVWTATEVPPRGAARKLFRLFWRDLGANLREVGVGDLAVPKRMRNFGEAFYGRQGAYLAALEAANPQEELEKALARNIFHGVNGDGPRRLARYMLAALREFDT